MSFDNTTMFSRSGERWNVGDECLIPNSELTWYIAYIADCGLVRLIHIQDGLMATADASIDILES